MCRYASNGDLAFRGSGLDWVVSRVSMANQ